MVVESKVWMDCEHSEHYSPVSTLCPGVVRSH